MSNNAELFLRDFNTFCEEHKYSSSHFAIEPYLTAKKKEAERGRIKSFISWYQGFRQTLADCSDERVCWRFFVLGKTIDAPFVAEYRRWLRENPNGEKLATIDAMVDCFLAYRENCKIQIAFIDWYLSRPGFSNTCFSDDDILARYPNVKPAMEFVANFRRWLSLQYGSFKGVSAEACREAYASPTPLTGQRRRMAFYSLFGGTPAEPKRSSTPAERAFVAWYETYQPSDHAVSHVLEEFNKVQHIFADRVSKEFVEKLRACRPNHYEGYIELADRVAAMRNVVKGDVSVELQFSAIDPVSVVGFSEKSYAFRQVFNLTHPERTDMPTCMARGFGDVPVRAAQMLRQKLIDLREDDRVAQIEYNIQHAIVIDGITVKVERRP